ncbi:MAG: ABC transporter permease subunit [Pseudomonadota bacterium]
MFEMCSDPSTLVGASWWACYLTTPKHMNLYTSILVVFGLLAATVPIILAFGFGGALARRSNYRGLRWFGTIYTSMVRGVPDIVFFLFVPIAFDQGLEYLRHLWTCPDWGEPVRQGNDFVVCAAAKLPLNTADQWVHETYGFFMAAFAFAIVFGAFAANILYGAMRVVPKGQLEAASAMGLSERQAFRLILIPQMWIYALPGLSNLWQILIKATPLLFLLGVEDIVYWARELGGIKTSRFSDYPHGDWRLGYFIFLLFFYLFLTWISEKVFARLQDYFSRGQAELRMTA